MLHLLEQHLHRRAPHEVATVVHHVRVVYHARTHRHQLTPRLCDRAMTFEQPFAALVERAAASSRWHCAEVDVRM